METGERPFRVTDDFEVVSVPCLRVEVGTFNGDSYIQCLLQRCGTISLPDL